MALKSECKLYKLCPAATHTARLAHTLNDMVVCEAAWTANVISF